MYLLTGVFIINLHLYFEKVTGCVRFFGNGVQSVLSTFSTLFRLHNPPFVNIIFCIFVTVSLILSNDFLRLHEISVLFNHKKAPSRQDSIYIRTCQKEAKPSTIYSFSCPNTCTSNGIAATITYNNPPLSYLSSYLYCGIMLYGLSRPQQKKFLYYIIFRTYIEMQQKNGKFITISSNSSSWPDPIQITCYQKLKSRYNKIEPK